MADFSPRSLLCFDCALKIGSQSRPLVAEDGSLSAPKIPELVNGLCPVCEGSRELDPDDLEG